MSMEQNLKDAFSAVGTDVKGIQDKLATVETGATGDQSASEIKSLYESNGNTNAFTDAEKSKLAGLESSKFLGTYTSLASLESAHPSPSVGSYAHVDSGVGAEVALYIWDADDSDYVKQASSSTSETASSIKQKYESNSNTNAFTDAEKSKLSGIEAGAKGDQSATEIESLYEGRPNTNKYTDAEKSKLADVGSTTANFLSSYTAARDA